MNTFLCTQRAGALITLLGLIQFGTDSRVGGAEPKQAVKSLQRSEAEYRKRAFPTNSIPAGARALALKQTEQLEASAQGPGLSPKGLGVAYWYNIGPAPITKSDYGGAAGYCSGRVTALATDPSSPTNHWLLGSAMGGIWETRDGGFWSPRTDDQASMAIGAIAFAPNNPLVVYAGTGEANFRGDDYAGAGLLLSSDGGTHWSMLNTNFAETSFSSIRVDPNNYSNLVVSTVRGGGGVTDAASGTNVIPGAPLRGIFVSTDAGHNFTRVLTGEATDTAVNPVNFSQQYGGLGEIYGAPANGVYRTLDGWTSAQLINGPWTVFAGPTEMGRVVFAMGGGPSFRNTLYVGVAAKRINYQADLIGIWRTDNAWAPTPTWTLIDPPPYNRDCCYSPRFWYHFSMLTDPADVNTLYLTEFDVWCRKNGNWFNISDGHPDNHVLAWAAGGSMKHMLLGNDGGIWLSDQSVQPTSYWLNMNYGLALTQIYRGAVDPRPESPTALGGTQDNGTPVCSGSLPWTFLWGGDGGDCAISSTHPDTDWAVSYDVQDFASHIARTLGGQPKPQRISWDLDSDLLPDYVQFYNHFEKSPRNDNLFIAGTARLWRCNNFFSPGWPTWSINGPQMTDASGAPVPISAMAFAPSDANGMIYAFGTEDGQLRLTTNGGNTWSDLNPTHTLPGRYVSGLAFSPADPNVLYVTFSGFNAGTPGHVGHVFRTPNASATPITWVDVSPPVDLPINCIAINPNDARTILVGGDIGVWTTSDAATTWTHYGPSSGMPNVAVFDIRMNSAGTPTAFTHGRSAYVLRTANIPIVQLYPEFACSACPPSPCLQCPPGDHWLNPEDLVAIDFPLQNMSPVDTVNLVATLLPSASITPVSGQQYYGALGAFGAPVTRRFQFIAHYSTPGPGCGTIAQAVLALSDGTNNLGTVTMPFMLGTPHQPLLETFDELQPPGLPPGWQTVASGVDQAWQTTSNSPPNADVQGEDAAPPVAGEISVFTPDSLGAGQTSITTPPFVVSTSQAQVYFRQAFSVTNGYDGCILQISTPGVPFTDILQAGGSFAQGGYNSRLNDFNPLGPRAAWSGNSGGWAASYLNLPASAVGVPVQLRWQFATSRGQTNGYWFIDQVQVTEPTCLPPVTNPVLLNPAINAAGGFSFSINTVTNRTYLIESKTNLTDSAWQFIRGVAGDGTTQRITVPLSGQQSFYRFRVQ